MIKIISPVEKTVQLIPVQQGSENPGSISRLDNKPVRYVHRLAGTIITPQLFRPFFQKRLNMIQGTYRLTYKPFFIKRIFRQRVNDLAVPKVFRHQFHRFLIAFQHCFSRLIGNMEKSMFQYAQLLQLFFQRAEKAVQKFCVFRTARIRLPAEDPPILSIFCPKDLRRAFGAPLGKQVGNLIINDAAPPAHLHPPPQLFKSKHPVTILKHHICQLYRKSVTSDRRIQRRRKHRRQDHVALSFDGCTDKILGDPPVFFAEYFHLIIFRQTV